MDKILAEIERVNIEHTNELIEVITDEHLRGRRDGINAENGEGLWSNERAFLAANAKLIAAGRYESWTWYECPCGQVHASIEVEN